MIFATPITDLALSGQVLKIFDTPITDSALGMHPPLCQAILEYQISLPQHATLRNVHATCRSTEFSNRYHLTRELEETEERAAARERHSCHAYHRFCSFKLPEAFWNILGPSGASLELPEHPGASWSFLELPDPGASWGFLGSPDAS